MPLRYVDSSARITIVAGVPDVREHPAVEGGGEFDRSSRTNARTGVTTDDRVGRTDARDCLQALGGSRSLSPRRILSCNLSCEEQRLRAARTTGRYFEFRTGEIPEEVLNCSPTSYTQAPAVEFFSLS
jgi:hypothetical protein